MDIGTQDLVLVIRTLFQGTAAGASKALAKKACDMIKKGMKLNKKQSGDLLEGESYMSSVTRKCDLRSFSLSYPKKDWILHRL